MAPGEKDLNRDMEINLYLFFAYLLVWTLLFSYLAYLQRKQRAVARKLESLAEALERETNHRG